MKGGSPPPLPEVADAKISCVRSVSAAVGLLSGYIFIPREICRRRDAKPPRLTQELKVVDINSIDFSDENIINYIQNLIEI